ncbi:MAG: hypothetical protein DRI90_16740 [Deltaproteobacteria bacterium]|nr:MAG: hypothetical protein DRI90_16740 [Deltaproteobacteria bacterium]
MTHPNNPLCPHCGQRAPITLRGIDARCTVCGGKRLPFTAKTLNLAGKPSRIGGIAARVVGWSIAVVGVAIASGFGLLLQTIFPGGYAGLAVGLPMAIISLFFGLGLVFGGRKLSRHGEDKERAAKEQTIVALAKHQNGAVTAAGVARAVDMREDEADALLTELAKDPNGNVSLELDDDGGIHYLFGVGSSALRFDPQGAYRIDSLDGGLTAEQEAAAIEEAETGRRLDRAQKR